MDRLYDLAEAQGGYLSAQQAIAAGVRRSTLGYDVGEGKALDASIPACIGSGASRRRPMDTSSPVGSPLHTPMRWCRTSALELFDLSDIIADEVHLSLPRAKRGLRTPRGVRAHFTDRPIDRRHRRTVLGVPVTSVERTLTDVLRTRGWTEQIELAVRQAVERGLTTRSRLTRELPAKWRTRVDAALGESGVA